MKNFNLKKCAILYIAFLPILLSSCSSSKLTLSRGVDLSNYKYVVVANSITGDHSLSDLILEVENEIGSACLTVSDYGPRYQTLAYRISVSQSNYETNITVTFRDYSNDRTVAVVKSSGMSEDMALSALRKELKKAFCTD